MLAKTFLAVLLAGILAGLLMTPVQYATTVPLVLEAETFEAGGGEPHDHSSLLPALVTPAYAHAVGGETTDAGRLLGTVLANVVVGAGFALVLLSASLALGRPLKAGSGALFGLAAFSIVTLAPAFGLPPELPAMPAADLSERQIWWAATVAATAAGAWCLFAAAHPLARGAGLLLILVPHVVGAPHPADLASAVPPTLAAEFAVASLGTTALFWAMIGVLAGLALARVRRNETAGLR